LQITEGPARIVKRSDSDAVTRQTSRTPLNELEPPSHQGHQVRANLREPAITPFEPISEQIDAVASQIVDSALSVHRALGPGLIEPVYERCLCYELSQRGLQVRSQVPIPILYRGVQLDAALRLDLLVEDSVIVELKAVENLIPLCEAQLLTYLRLANKRLGLLINFNVTRLKDGIKRLVL
jgi:GxxExxY protein